MTPLFSSSFVLLPSQIGVVQYVYELPTLHDYPTHCNGTSTKVMRAMPTGQQAPSKHLNFVRDLFANIIALFSLLCIVDQMLKKKRGGGIYLFLHVSCVHVVVRNI